jgi:hypothetical protein
MTSQPPPDSDSEAKPSCNVRYDKLEKLRKYLKTSEFGKTISQIAVDLKLSRVTVKVYLNILQNEGEAYCKEIGPAKIWFSEKSKETAPETRIPDFVRAFLMQLMNSVEKHNTLPPDAQNMFFKELGKEVGQKVAWPGEADFSNSLTNVVPRMRDVKAVVKQFLKIIEDTGIFLKAEIVPPVKKDTEVPILIRSTFHKPEWGEFKQYYNLMAGYFEAKIQMIFGTSVYMAVQEIEPDGQWCYYILGIKEKVE